MLMDLLVPSGIISELLKKLEQDDQPRLLSILFVGGGESPFNPPLPYL